MTKLLYTGLSMETLHAEYAARGRIDGQAAVTASREVVVAAPVARVWALLGDPHGWGRIDPGIRDVRLDGEVAPGTRFVWRNGRAGITSRFAVVDPEREITWTGLSSGAKAVHRHLLAARDENHTHLVSQESMGGPLLPLFFSSARLAATLDMMAGRDQDRSRADRIVTTTALGCSPCPSPHNQRITMPTTDPRNRCDPVLARPVRYPRGRHWLNREERG